MKTGDLVGIQWKEGIGYVGSKKGEHVGLVLESAARTFLVYCPTVKTFGTVKCWDMSWLVRLSYEV